MIRSLIGAGALVVLASGPSLAVAPDCHDQLTQVRAEMAGNPHLPSADLQKYNEAERLCADGKEMQAQQLAREIRDDIAEKGMSGSSNPPGPPYTPGEALDATKSQNQNPRAK